MNTLSDMIQEIDGLRTDALRPLRLKLMNDERFVGKSIEISGDGPNIHVTIAGKFGVSITKTAWHFEDEINLANFYETSLFEVVDGGEFDLKHNTIKYVNDDETEKIAKHILGYMTSYNLFEGDVSFIFTHH